MHPKLYNEMSNVGACKYVVNTYDGHDTHPDGSPFFGIAIFSNKRKKDQFLRRLRTEGYIYGTVEDAMMNAGRPIRT